MAYPAGHFDEVRGKIVQSARRQFNRHGFERVSVDQIMAGAGLTRGGFYSYFKSKSELYIEVLGCFSLTRSGRVAGRAWKSILLQKTWVRKWWRPIFQGSTLKMLRTRARWWPCLAM